MYISTLFDAESGIYQIMKDPCGYVYAELRCKNGNNCYSVFIDDYQPDLDYMEKNGYACARYVHCVEINSKSFEIRHFWKLDEFCNMSEETALAMRPPCGKNFKKDCLYHLNDILFRRL